MLRTHQRVIIPCYKLRCVGCFDGQNLLTVISFDVSGGDTTIEMACLIW